MTASAGTQNAPREDERDLVRPVCRWIATHCVIDARCASNPKILCREFRLWSKVDCSVEDFLSAMEKCGFGVGIDGLIGRVALAEDVAVAMEYEREREQTEPGEKG